MFISDRVVYVELEKTGCTHIRRLLMEIVGGRLKGKHNQVNSRLLSESPLLLGSVRDPWDWYVSCWGFGCDRKGVFVNAVTRPGIKLKGHGWKTNPYLAFLEFLRQQPNNNAQQWRRTYQDPNDAGAFREWLHMVYDQEYRFDFGGEYGHLPLSQVVGWLSYRYLKLFCCKRDARNDLDSIVTFEQLADYNRRNCLVDEFIRNESLESDLFRILERADIRISDELKSKMLSRSKSNTSSRKRDTEYYFDPETERLVAERERLIVEKFHYTAPSLQQQELAVQEN